MPSRICSFNEVLHRDFKVALPHGAVIFDLVGGHGDPKAGNMFPGIWVRFYAMCPLVDNETSDIRSFHSRILGDQIPESWVYLGQIPGECGSTFIFEEPK